MGRSYSVTDARTHLRKILDEVQAGREVHLTRRGVPIAVVVSADRAEMLRAKRPSFPDAYRAFLQRHSPDDIGMDAEAFDSLRDETLGRGTPNGLK